MVNLYESFDLTAHLSIESWASKWSRWSSYYWITNSIFTPVRRKSSLD